MDFSYEVTLSPDNDRKWQEMISDPITKKVLIEMYQLIVSNDREGVNEVIEKCYQSYRAGVLENHFESFKKLYTAGEFLKDYKL